MQMSATKKREDEGGVQRDLGEQLLKIGRFPQPPPGYLLSPFYGRGVCRSEHTVPSHRHSDRKSRLLEGWLGCVSVRYDKNSDPEMTVTKATDYPPKSLETGGTANTQDQSGRHQGESGGKGNRGIHRQEPPLWFRQEGMGEAVSAGSGWASATNFSEILDIDAVPRCRPGGDWDRWAAAQSVRSGKGDVGEESSGLVGLQVKGTFPGELRTFSRSWLT